MSTTDDIARSNRQFVRHVQKAVREAEQQRVRHEDMDRQIFDIAREVSPMFGPVEVMKFAKAAAKGEATDPYSFFAMLKFKLDYPLGAAEHEAAAELAVGPLPGLTRGGAPLPLDQYGRTGFFAWQERHAPSLRARGVNVEGSSGVGETEQVRLSCLSCGQDWHVLLGAPLTADKVVCPSRCNARGTSW